MGIANYLQVQSCSIAQWHGSRITIIPSVAESSRVVFTRGQGPESHSHLMTLKWHMYKVVPPSYKLVYKPHENYRYIISPTKTLVKLELCSSTSRFRTGDTGAPPCSDMTVIGLKTRIGLRTIDFLGISSTDWSRAHDWWWFCCRVVQWSIENQWRQSVTDHPLAILDLSKKYQLHY